MDFCWLGAARITSNQRLPPLWYRELQGTYTIPQHRPTCPSPVLLRNGKQGPCCRAVAFRFCTSQARHGIRPSSVPGSQVCIGPCFSSSIAIRCYSVNERACVACAPASSPSRTLKSAQVTSLNSVSPYVRRHLSIAPSPTPNLCHLQPRSRSECCHLQPIKYQNFTLRTQNPTAAVRCRHRSSAEILPLHTTRSGDLRAPCLVVKIGLSVVSSM